MPQSIIQNELLPRYRERSEHLRPHGPGGEAQPDGHINVVQPPGAPNALGRIKFNFPNKFQVYLHDTPEKRLFASDKRAFSHGCMRVEDPTKFGEIMHAAGDARPDAERAAAQRACSATTSASSSLVNRPMVHLTYQTAFVDDAGKLALRDDIYGFDARIDAILHGDERASPTWRRRRTQARAGERRGPTRKSCAGSSGARQRTFGSSSKCRR